VFTPGFNVVCAAHSLVFCVVFCRSLFIPLSFFFWPLHSSKYGRYVSYFRLDIVLSILHRFTVSDYPFGIVKSSYMS